MSEHTALQEAAREGEALAARVALLIAEWEDGVLPITRAHAEQLRAVLHATGAPGVPCPDCGGTGRLPGDPT